MTPRCTASWLWQQSTSHGPHGCRTLSAGLLGLYILIAALLYVSYLGRFAALLTNRAVASVLILLSLLIVAIIGALPFLSTAILDTRNTTFDLDELHRGHMAFLSAMAAGPRYDGGAVPWRQDSDVDVADGDRSLAGGWYTGPGLSKFTYPQVRRGSTRNSLSVPDPSAVPDLSACCFHADPKFIPGCL